jgi:O-antigen/teichoic acid export membrane protein
MRQLKRWQDLRIFTSLSWPRLNQAAFSITDQALSVGGMFLANVALARAQTKEEYGMFALSYSVFTFLAGLHNASVLEPYTVYGSGRYHQSFPEYERLLWRCTAILGAALTASLLLIWVVLSRIAPNLGSRSLLGMALTSGIILTAAFVRRTFYIQRQPRLAARLSIVFFVTVALFLGLFVKAHILNGLSTFLIVALGWIVGGLFLKRHLWEKSALRDFADLHPGYWSEHWKYARWVVATAFVFQLTTQGYYWLVAGLLSLKEVAELRAIYLLVTPVDQLFVALSFMVLPMMAFRYASKRIADLFTLWKIYAALCIVVTVSFAAVVRFYGAPALHLLYGGKFDGVAALLAPLALLPVVMGIGNTMNAALKSIEKPNLVLYAYLASGTATFLAGIPLVVHFGLSGAVYGMLVSASVYTAALGVGFISSIQPGLHAARLSTGAD